MAQKVRIDQLANEIAKAMREYTEPVEKGIRKAIDQTATEALGEIVEASPVRKSTGGGKYKRGWKIEKDDGTHRTKRVIWNRARYRLVHLLEKGHAKRGGGRVAGIPHVGPAEKKYSTKLLKRIQEVVKRGGK